MGDLACWAASEMEVTRAGLEPATYGSKERTLIEVLKRRSLLSQGAVGFAAVTGMNCPGSIFPSRTV